MLDKKYEGTNGKGDARILQLLKNVANGVGGRVFDLENTKVLIQAMSLDGSSQDFADTRVNGNYATETEFYIECPEGQTYYVTRLIVNCNIDADAVPTGYAGGTALTNGIELFAYDGTSYVSSNFENMKIFRTSDFSNWAATDVIVQPYDPSFFGGAAGGSILVRATFTKYGGAIKLTPGQRLGIRVNDDFTNKDLVEHRFICHGYISNEVE